MKTTEKNCRLFFNQSCALCSTFPATETGLCEGCHTDLPWLVAACRRCAEPLTSHQDLLCPNCVKDPPPFDRTHAAFRYSFPINQIIPTVKYHRRPAMLGWLSRSLAQLMRDRLENDIPEALIPVPMHPWRSFRRGFNQAELIAAILGQELGIPVIEKGISRKAGGAHQAELNRQERLANLRHSFQVRRTLPASVAIVDDVMTTGATARELARTLREHGAVHIQIWALARTPS